MIHKKKNGRKSTSRQGLAIHTEFTQLRDCVPAEDTPRGDPSLFDLCTNILRLVIIRFSNESITHNCQLEKVLMWYRIPQLPSESLTTLHSHKWRRSSSFIVRIFSLPSRISLRLRSSKSRRISLSKSKYPRYRYQTML
ncbi:hypothetical protein ACOME3_001463 [Neoechinorhynchus agilis]